MLLGCCCPPSVDCTIFTDDFARESLGEDWTVLTGDASIESEKLELSGTNVVVRSNTQASNQAMRATATGEYPGTGDANLRVIVALLDADNYLYGDVRYSDGFPVGLRLFEVVGGTHSQLRTTSLDFPSDPTTLTVCYEPGGYGSGRLRAEAHGKAISVLVDGPGDFAGVGSSDDDILIDSFVLDNGESEEHPECPSCNVTEVATCEYVDDEFNSHPICDPNPVAEYVVTLAGSSLEDGRCNCSVITDGEYILDHFSGCTWRTAVPMGPCDPPVCCIIDPETSECIEFLESVRIFFEIFQVVVPSITDTIRFQVRFAFACGGASTASGVVTYAKDFTRAEMPLDCGTLDITLDKVSDNLPEHCGTESSMPSSVNVRAAA